MNPEEVQAALDDAIANGWVPPKPTPTVEGVVMTIIGVIQDAHEQTDVESREYLCGILDELVAMIPAIGGPRADEAEAAMLRLIDLERP